MPTVYMYKSECILNALCLLLSLSDMSRCLTKNTKERLEASALWEVLEQKLGSLTMSGVILSHLHFLHTVSWEPACTALHGSLPEASLPNAEHWGKSRQVVRAKEDSRVPSSLPPDNRVLPTTLTLALFPNQHPS